MRFYLKADETPKETPHNSHREERALFASITAYENVFMLLGRLMQIGHSILTNRLE